MDDFDKAARGAGVVIGLVLLANVIFWGAVIALGFYAVNQFSN
jgi:hypothetical protein